jgi:hypothetical protein
MVCKLIYFNYFKLFFQKYFVLSVFFVILPFGNVLSQNKLDLNFIAGVGSYFPFIDNGFMDTYQSVIGGVQDEPKYKQSYYVALQFRWSESYRVFAKVIKVEYALSDKFDKETAKGSNKWREHIENMTFQDTPILIGLEFGDFTQRYRSFLSVGGGMTSSHITWIEYVSSSILNDIRHSGINYDDTNYYPVIVLSSGISLDFDPKSVPKLIKGIVISGDVLYTYRREKIFEELYDQFYTEIPELIEKHAIIPFAVGINFAINFNINNEK